MGLICEINWNNEIWITLIIKHLLLKKMYFSSDFKIMISMLDKSVLTIIKIYVIVYCSTISVKDYWHPTFVHESQASDV